METWQPIPGHPGYEASDLGNIRSTDRVILRSSTPMTVRGKVLHPWRNTAPNQWSGAILVGVNGNKQRPVGQLVLEAFVGPRPPGLEMCHRDDDPWNNTLPNLYWGTRSENRRDLVRNGRHNHARKTHCKNDHPFSGPNLYVTPQGHRQCRACNNARRRSPEHRR